MRSLSTVLSFIFVINFLSYSQTEIDKTIFKAVSLNQTETIIINIRSYDQSVIGKLKDDLIAFDEKVNSVHIDEENSLLEITYNDKMLLEDLILVFEMNHVNYLKDPKGKGKVVTTKHEQL